MQNLLVMSSAVVDDIVCNGGCDVVCNGGCDVICNGRCDVVCNGRYSPCLHSSSQSPTRLGEGRGGANPH